MLPHTANYASNAPSTSFMPGPSSFGSTGFTPQPSFAPTFLGQNYLLDPTKSVAEGVELSPHEAFREQIRLAAVEVGKLQMMARTVLNNIQNAYQRGYAPHHTQADIDRLHEQLHATIEFLRMSGVGSLPVLNGLDPSLLPIVPNEQTLQANTQKGYQVLYDQLQKAQESSNVVANLLASGG